MDKIDISFLENISKLTKYERLAKIKKITNKYDKLLLIELINELTTIEIDFIYKFNDSLNNEPDEKPILYEGDISFNLLSFTFFTIRQINHTIFEIVSYQQEHFFNKLDFKDLNIAYQYFEIIDELIFILNDKYKDIINLDLNNKIESNTNNVKLSDTSTTEKTNNFDPNNFNNSCYNLFYYLVENYKKKGKIKFINIYYYLKDEVNKEKYSFKFTQSEYTEFIKEKYQIEIKKYQKAHFDFDEQKRVLNSLEEQFRK